MAVAVDVPAIDDVSHTGYDARAGVALAEQPLELLGRVDFLCKLFGEAMKLSV